MTNRSVETTEDFKVRIAAIIGDKRERIPGAPRPNPLLVRGKKRASTPPQTSPTRGSRRRV
jgi:hypothetical protein